MNGHAIFDNCRYTLEESLTAVGSEGDIIICRRDDGTRYACLSQIWEEHVERITTFPDAKVTNQSTSEDKIALFRSLFRGRDDLFAKRWYNLKSGKSGYSPTCRNEWAEDLCNKKAVSCGKCPNRSLLPISEEVIYRHLEGKDAHARDVIGLYPMLQDETTYFLAIDFDGEDWEKDVTAFCTACSDYHLSPAVERSRSGNGGHVWLFFNEPVSAVSARKLGSGLLSRTMEHHATLKLKSYDRLFPNQDTLPKGGFGNLIALPLQGKARRAGNSVFIDSQFKPWPDQWAFLSGVEKIGGTQLEGLLHIICCNGELGELASSGNESKPWEHPQPIFISSSDFPEKVELTLADGIYIHKDGLSEAVMNKIKRLAAFRNPDFYKAQAMRLPTYNKPRVIDTSLNLKDYIRIPRGCLDALTEILTKYNISDERNPGRAIDVSFSGELREEQTPAADAMLEHEMGVLSATTAFGKTVLGAYLVGTRKVNTLILVHSSALLTQWKKALEQFLAFPEPQKDVVPSHGRQRKDSWVGQLGSGKNTLTGTVDIAIMQSLMKGGEVNGIVRNYGLVICDECHHVPAVGFEQILSSVNARYVYGLTATPIRADGHQPIIFMQCGPIRYHVDAKIQAKKRNFEHFLIPRFTPTRIPDAAELTIQEAYTKLINDDMRNKLIVSDVISSLNEGRSPLILTERKEHAEVIAEYLKSASPHVLLLTGSDGQKQKREKLEQLKAISPDRQLIVVATGKYIGEGFDEPRLDTLFLAMPIAWKGTLAQYAGRLHRGYLGKHEVRIYDYVDVYVRVFEKMYQKRLRGYADLGYQVHADEDVDKINIIFDNRNFDEPFVADLVKIENSALIISPILCKARVLSIMKLFSPSLKEGKPITIVTRPPQDYKPEQQPSIAQIIDIMKDEGVTVITRSGIYQKYAVFDKTIVWYGSISFLSFSNNEETVMRFENSSIAGELLNAATEG